jgi:Ca2+-binding RTX toxin-like protein
MATYIGNNLNNYYFGTIGNDSIVGNGGNDTLTGAEGSDTILGGAGNDFLVGGVNSFNDDLAGDLIDGGAGDDTVYGAVGDTLKGGTGIDSLILDLRTQSSGVMFNGAESNHLSGVTQALGFEIFNITGTQFDDTLIGGARDDSLSGEAGNDLLRGNSGNDSIDGDSGSDTIFGGAGNDHLHAGVDNNSNPFGDLIFADSGNDTVYGGLTDTLRGGRGIDTLFLDLYQPGPPPNEGVLFDGSNTNHLSGDTQAQGFEVFNVSGTGANDTLIGGNNDDTLYGNDGDDTIVGGAGNDYLVGEFGLSFLSGIGGNFISAGSGNDTVFGNSQDTVDGGSGNDFLYLDLSLQNSAVVFDGSSENHLSGVSQAQNFEVFNVTGTSSNDVMTGGTGNDILYGAFGSDTISGGAGDDLLRGDSPTRFVIGETSGNLLSGDDGNDTLFGSLGSDTLIGGAGNDQLYGNLYGSAISGTGDYYRFDTYGGNAGVDQIYYFNVDRDTIQISASGFGGGLVSGTTLSADQFVLGTAALDSNDRFIYDGTTGALYYDVDGSGTTAQVQIATLSTGLALTQNDFQII